MENKRKRSAAAMPRAGRKVTIEDLERLETSQATHYLYCRRCYGEYSADTADYFWAKAGHVFRCCKVNCILLHRAPLPAVG